MSNIFALTEDAKRRAEGSSCRYCKASSAAGLHPDAAESKTDNETILLLIVLLLLYRAGAGTMLMLAIMYVTL